MLPSFSKQKRRKVIGQRVMKQHDSERVLQSHDLDFMVPRMVKQYAGGVNASKHAHPHTAIMP